MLFRSTTGITHIKPMPATTIHVITTGGMTGWQITLIAVAAALLAGPATRGIRPGPVTNSPQWCR